MKVTVNQKKYHSMDRKYLLGAISVLISLSAKLVASPGPVDIKAAIEPKVITRPGSDYSDENRNFQGIPTIEVAPNGRLWAAWYGGGSGEAEMNYIMLATSDDGGEQWSEVKYVVDPDGSGPVRAFDPVLWHDPTGKLWLFWAQQTGLPSQSNIAPELFAMTTANPNSANPSWSKPRWIASGILMNKPTVLKNGAWLLPTAIWQRKDSNRIFRSTDQGNTWNLIGTANVPNGSRNCDEPMIIELSSGNLWMLVRTNYGIGESFSTNSGESWTDVRPSRITSAVSRFHITRLSNGDILLIKHDVTDIRDRSRLAAYLSKDDGVTWSDGLVFDERGGVSYPDAVEAENGTINVIYDRGRTNEKEILMAAIQKDDIEQCRISNPEKLKVLVNQATGRE